MSEPKKTLGDSLKNRPRWTRFQNFDTESSLDAFEDWAEKLEKTVEKFLERLETPFRAGSMFTPQEEWGMIYALKWVLGYDVSELMKDVDERAKQRFDKYKKV